MKMLKMQSFKSILLILLIAFGLGIGILAVAIPDAITLAQGPIPLEEVDFNGDFEGLYVTTTLPIIYDCYCEETSDNEIVSREYIIDADDVYYMGLRARNDDMNDADQLYDAYMAYLEGTDDGTRIYESQYEVTGIITKMPDDSEEFYYELVDWYGEDRALFLPYYINVNILDSSTLVMYGILILIAFGFGIYFIVALATGRYQKEVKKYINSCPNAELATAKVENFLSTVPLEKGMRYNHEFICGNNNGTTIFGETSKVAWVYKHVTRQKLYYIITIGKSYGIVLGFADGTRQMVSVKNEAVANEHLENLQKLCPKAVFGYSDDLNRMFNGNMAQFLSLRYNAPETTASTEEQSGANTPEV